MRVLMTSWAWPTHYFPMVPLGWALRAAGHQVHVASQPAMTDAITRSGHIAVRVGADVDYAELVRRDVGEDVDFAASVRRHLGEDVDLADLMRRGREALSPAARRRWQELRHASMLRGLRPFAAVAEAMTDGLVEYARAWRPDVIVYEPTTYAGPIAATLLGVPSVRHLWGVDYTHQTHAYESEALAALLARYGLTEIDTLGDLTIDPCPPAAQITADYPRQLVRYVPYNGPGGYPDWLHTPPARPRVCLTWGSSTARLGGQGYLAPEVLAAIGAPDIEVVAAVPTAARPLLPADRPDVRVVEQLPLHLLLPTCDLVVHQGGMGTTMTAITHGVPQIIIPQLPDQIFNAKMLAKAEAAVVLTRERLAEPGALQREVDRLLGDPAYRERARRLQAVMNGQPPLATAVDRIRQLADHARDMTCASS